MKFYSSFNYISLCYLFLSILMLTSCKKNETQSTLKPRFNHVFLAVADMDRSIAFYTTAFDLQVTGSLTKMKRTPQGGETEEMDIKLSFLKFPEQDFVLEIGERINFSSNNAAANFTHLGVDVTDIEAASERIIKAGGKQLRPITLVETDVVVAKNAFYAGPDGETIELMQMIKGEF